MVNITLNRYGSCDNGRILMTPQLVNDSEIDFEVDRLVEQLEKIRKDNERIRSLL